MAKELAIQMDNFLKQLLPSRGFGPEFEETGESGAGAWSNPSPAARAWRGRSDEG